MFQRGPGAMAMRVPALPESCTSGLAKEPPSLAVSLRLRAPLGGMASHHDQAVSSLHPGCQRDSRGQGLQQVLEEATEQESQTHESTSSSPSHPRRPGASSALATSWFSQHRAASGRGWRNPLLLQGQTDAGTRVRKGKFQAQCRPRLQGNLNKLLGDF